MFGLAGVVSPNVVHVPGGANASLAKPQPPWTLRALVLKSVLLPRAALQSTSFWSSGLSLANKASSGSVCRGPAGNIQVTPSESPSGWQEAQLLQALFEALPRLASGTMSRMGVLKRP